MQHHCVIGWTLLMPCVIMWMSVMLFILKQKVYCMRMITSSCSWFWTVVSICGSGLPSLLETIYVTQIIFWPIHPLKSMTPFYFPFLCLWYWDKKMSAIVFETTVHSLRSQHPLSRHQQCWKLPYTASDHSAHSVGISSVGKYRTQPLITAPTQ